MNEALNVVWHDLGDAGELRNGEPRSYTVGGTRFCLIRDGERLYAISDKCSHGPAFLSEGFCGLAEGTIECPLHAGLFDFRNGAVLCRPALRPVKTFPAEIKNGKLFLGLAEA